MTFDNDWAVITFLFLAWLVWLFSQLSRGAPIKTQPLAKDQAYTFSSLIWGLAEIVFSFNTFIKILISIWTSTEKNFAKSKKKIGIISPRTILNHFGHGGKCRYFNVTLHFHVTNPILWHQFYRCCSTTIYYYLFLSSLMIVNDRHFTMIMQVTSEYSILWGALGFQTRACRSAYISISQSQKHSGEFLLSKSWSLISLLKSGKLCPKQFL